jgi:hypothetical protein
MLIELGIDRAQVDQCHSHLMERCLPFPRLPFDVAVEWFLQDVPEPEARRYHALMMPLGRVEHISGPSAVGGPAWTSAAPANAAAHPGS